MELQDLADQLLERLDRLNTKIDATKDHVARIDVAMARRDQLPDRVTSLELSSQEHSDQISKVRGGIAVLGLLGALGGAAKWLWP